MLELYLLVFGIFLSILYLILKSSCFGKSSKTLPPGPWGLPLFGHLLFMGKKPHETLKQWGKKYGPIIFCKFGSYPTVVLQDGRMIKQAFSTLAMAGRAEILPYVEGSQKKGIIFSEGAHNTQQRQFAIRNLKDMGMGKKSIEWKILDGLQEFLDRISQNEGVPLNSSCLMSQYVINTLWAILFTKQLSEEELDHFVPVVQEKLNRLGGVLSQLALFMPWMERLTQLVSFGSRSLTNFKKEGFQEVYRFMATRIEERKRNRVKDEPISLIDVYLDQVDKTTESSSSFYEKHETSQYFCGDLFMAGIETTATTLEWVFCYLIHHPQVQRKIQKEIDTVVGSSRLPSLSDKLNLPYVEAVIYETLRKSTPLPLGLHHRTLTEVSFKNYVIPKDTMVFGNLYAVHHDEKVWGDPDNFRPERWLAKDAAMLKSDHFLPFVFGKRACIGEIFAKDQIFMYLTTILQRFNISAPEDKIPPIKCVQGVIVAPEKFKLIFTSRKTQ